MCLLVNISKKVSVSRYVHKSTNSSQPHTSQFQPLLGQTLVAIARVALVTPNSAPSPLMDTLLLTLEDDRIFELLVGQDWVRFEEVQDERLFAGFELEPGEQLGICPIAPITLLPQTIENLTEVWAGEGDERFLVAVSLWGKDSAHILSVCTEGDEVELMGLEELRQRLDAIVG